MARLLLDHGYRDVRPLLGGFDAWIESGYPVEAHRVVTAQTVALSGSETAG
jgi:3-mercaptopyruvate sulfurtransferase SseA